VLLVTLRPETPESGLAGGGGGSVAARRCENVVLIGLSVPESASDCLMDGWPIGHPLFSIFSGGRRCVAQRTQPVSAAATLGWFHAHRSEKSRVPQLLTQPRPICNALWMRRSCFETIGLLLAAFEHFEAMNTTSAK